MTEKNPTNLNEATPTDPKLDPLLGEALAPGQAPEGLNDRILAATIERLAHVDADAASEEPAVIATIGGGFAWRSVAAVLLFALIIGGVWVANRDAGDPVDTPNVDGPEVVQVEPGKIESVLTQLAESELEAEWIDDRIEWVSLQVSLAEDQGESDAWIDPLDSLDTAIALETFEDVADELEWYF